MRHFDTSTSALRDVADLIPLMVSAVDRDGAYHYVNKHYARYFGMSPQDFVGKRVDEIIPLDDPAFDDAARLALVRHCIDTGSDVEQEARIRRQDGERRKLIVKLCGDREAGLCYGFLADVGQDPLTESLERDLVRALARRY